MARATRGLERFAGTKTVAGLVPETANHVVTHCSARQRCAEVGTCAVDRQHIVADAYQDHQLPGGRGLVAIATMNTPTARSGSVSAGCCDAISVLLHDPDGYDDHAPDVKLDAALFEKFP